MNRIISTLLGVLLFSSSFAQDPDAKKIFKLGVCTSITNHQIVADAGFDYIEEGVGRFLVPLRPEEEFLAKLEVLKQSSIPILACNGFLPGSLKTTGPVTNHEEILAYAETAFRRAQMAGIKNIVFGSSGSRSYPEGFSHDKALEQFISLLSRMGPIARKYNINVVIEPLRKGECNLVNRVEEAYQIAIQINDPNIRVLGDVYHMMKETEGPESLIEARKWLTHMHIAELENRTSPGTAGDDFTPYLQAMKIAGYNGGLSIEGKWDKDFAKALVIGRAYLQAQINTLE